MYFAKNLKFLRKRRQRTQDEVAFKLGIPRSTLNNYENAISGPTLQALLTLSNYYHVAIDTLLKNDLSQLRESQLYALEHGKDVFIRGTKIRILATTVNSENRDNIELVNEKAKAGYLTGFSDPEFLAELPRFQLPFLQKERKYRTFQVSGESMPPVTDGSWVTGEFVQDWYTIKSGEPCIILTLNDGLVFKKVYNEIKTHRRLRLVSTHPDYEPYTLPIVDVKEVWRVQCYFSLKNPYF